MPHTLLWLSRALTTRGTGGHGGVKSPTSRVADAREMGHPFLPPLLCQLEFRMQFGLRVVADPHVELFGFDHPLL